MPESRLRVEYCGESTLLVPGETLTFGRAADLIIDANPHLHRHLGTFVFSEGVWWLVNEGSAISMLVADADSPSSATITSGNRIAVSFENSLVRFSAGPTSYELAVCLLSPQAHQWSRASTVSTDRTLLPSELPLTSDQLRLIVALAEQQLLNPHGPITVPTNREAAARLGWTLTRLNRKLDNVCQKLHQAGVKGLHGSSGSLARDRRIRLVDAAIEMRIVTPAHLELLDVGGEWSPSTPA